MSLCWLKVYFTLRNPLLWVANYNPWTVCNTKIDQKVLTSLHISWLHIWLMLHTLGLYTWKHLSFSRHAFVSDYLTDLKLHRTKYIWSKIAPSGIWTHNLQIISLMLCQLNKVTIWLWMWIIKAFITSCSSDSRNKKSPTCKVLHETKESSLQKSPTDSSLAQLAKHETDD